MPRPLRDITDRLVLGIDFGPDCWLWTGERNWAGYGRVKVKSVEGVWKWIQAHRLAYELAVGPIPAGLQIDHLCGNRGCVNPDHLQPVTGYVNTHRSNGPAALNARKTHCPQGHEYDEANTDRSCGRRHCRICTNAYKARVRQRNREAS